MSESARRSREDEEVQQVLTDNLKHLVHHVDIITTLLGESGG